MFSLKWSWYPKSFGKAQTESSIVHSPRQQLEKLTVLKLETKIIIWPKWTFKNISSEIRSFNRAQNFQVLTVQIIEKQQKTPFSPPLLPFPSPPHPSLIYLPSSPPSTPLRNPMDIHYEQLKKLCFIATLTSLKLLLSYQVCRKPILSIKCG